MPALKYGSLPARHPIRIISSMLKNGQDKVRTTVPNDTAVPKGHGITRGAAYFAKGGDRS